MFSWKLCVKMDRTNQEYRNMVKLPPQILETCIEKNKSFPYFFEIKTEYNHIFVGVSDFSSNADEVILPESIARKYVLFENQIITVKLLWNIPFAKLITLQPLTKEFFLIPEYETMLEKELSKYVLVFQHQELLLHHDNMSFPILVKEIQPDWSKVVIQTYVERCYNIIDQNIETSIENTFQQDFIQEEKEEEERTCMKKEDINYYEEPRILPSREEMCRRRLEKYMSSRNQSSKK